MRGKSSKIIIKSAKSKVPPQFHNFLSEGTNKTRLIELMFEVMESNKVKVLNLLRTNELFLSMENNCRLLTHSSSEDVSELQSNQEEADTRVVLHAMHALSHGGNIQSVVIRSPSGDTDIVVLTIAHLMDFKEKVYLDSGRADARRLIPLGSVELAEQHINALLGFHAFTGNDYVSSFFTKGKKTCWKKFIQNPKFSDCFKALGKNVDLSAELFHILEEFVCLLYGSRKKEVDEVRYHMFKKKNGTDDK